MEIKLIVQPFDNLNFDNLKDRSMSTACYQCNLTKESLIFTECSHFLCLSCALLNATSQAFISLKCCKIVTWLQEQSRLVLEALKQEKDKTTYEVLQVSKKQSQVKKQSEVKFQSESKKHCQSKKQSDAKQMKQGNIKIMTEEKENIIQRKSLQESIFITNTQMKEWKQQHQRQSSFSPKSKNLPLADRALRLNDRHSVETPKEDTSMLPLLQQLLAAHLQSVKHRFQLKHMELAEREDAVVRAMCESYTDQISLLGGGQITEQDVLRVKNTLERVSQSQWKREREREREDMGLGYSKSRRKTDDTPQYLRNDKILQKLQYNQQKMRERLAKHYMPA